MSTIDWERCHLGLNISDLEEFSLDVQTHTIHPSASVFFFLLTYWIGVTNEVFGDCICEEENQTLNISMLIWWILRGLLIWTTSCQIQNKKNVIKQGYFHLFSTNGI